MSHRGEPSMVPEADFESYYGRPVIKSPTWKTPDVPFCLFLGGLAGASAVLAEGAALRRLPELETVARSAAAGGAGLGTVFLVHDLGRPERFLKMLRLFKVTSPLSVGSFILAPFSGFASVSLASRITGWFPRLGRLAGLGAAALGPGLATYTAALIANTAVPIWHEGHRELPFVFGGSGAAAAGGVAMLFAPAAEHTPAARMAVLGGTMELASSEVMDHRLGMLAEPYHRGRPRALMRASKALTLAGHGLTVLGTLAGDRPLLRRLAGAAYVAGSVSLRFAIFEGGQISAKDPKYTVVPQKERLASRARATMAR